MIATLLLIHALLTGYTWNAGIAKVSKIIDCVRTDMWLRNAYILKTNGEGVNFS